MNKRYRIVLTKLIMLVLIITVSGCKKSTQTTTSSTEATTQSTTAESSSPVSNHSDLILHYDFNSIEGTVIRDRSGQGNDGVNHGGTSVEKGLFDGTISLDGVDDYLELPDQLLSGLDKVTISTWIKLNTNDPYARVFDFGSGVNSWMYFTFKNYNGDHQLGIKAATDEILAVGKTSLGVDEWHHVVVVKTGSLGILYIDGVEVFRSLMPIKPSEILSTTQNYIGKSQFDVDPYLNGQMDDFRIYSRSFTEDEIVSMMTEELNDEMVVNYTNNWLNLGNSTLIVRNLNLPETGFGNSTITWSSSDETVVTHNGVVNRPLKGTGDQTVTLTATIKKGNVQINKSFTVTVLAEGATQYVLDIDASNKLHEVSSTLYGAFFEDINYAADGGLYGEMLQNRSFEFGETLFSWKTIQGNGVVNVSKSNTNPLNSNNPTYIKINAINAGNGVGISNSGYTGLAIQNGEKYAFTLYARSRNALSQPLTIALKGTDNSVYGSCQISGITTEWKQYGCTITSSQTATNASLELTLHEEVSIDVDMVSLFPENTWNNRPNGLRSDLAQMLDDLNPSFLRFPGGCIVEGGSIENHYRWKNTIGDVAQREVQRNQWSWNYYQSFGLGYDEYFQLSEDLGAEPLPIVYVGITSCTGNPPMVPLDELQPYIDHVLDLIEYANGDVTTEWGAVRAANGHPEPYNLKYLGVGNELWGQNYLDRYKMFYDAIKAEYPEMNLVLSAGAFPNDGSYHYAYDWLERNNNSADLVDEHMYQSPQWFIDNVNRYDRFDRTGSKVFVGEYAAHGANRRNNMEAALAEAAFMTGLEQNSDVVAMAAYAPLFAHVNYTQWAPDLIWFNNNQVYGTPSYYVQSLFSNNVGSHVLDSNLTKRYVENKTITGSILLGTWNTQVEYDDVVVKGANNEVIFSDDFSSNTLNQWNEMSGSWSVSNGILKQTSNDSDTRLMVDKGINWSNYTLTLKARKTSGNEGMLIGFAVKDTDNYYWWNIGGWGNTQTAVEKSVGGVKSIIGTAKSHSVETNEWYNIKIEVKGENVKLYLNNTLMHDITESLNGGPLFNVTTVDEETGDIIIKVVNISNESQISRININNASYINSEGIVTILNANPSTENSLDNPNNLLPSTEKISGFGNSFEYEFIANSVTIIRLKTTETFIESVEQIEQDVAVGVMPVLPSTVAVTLNNGTTQHVVVDWNDFDAVQYATPGQFVVKGTVEGTNLVAKVVIKVN